MIAYQFDPVSSWAEQNPVHLKVNDPTLISVLLDFVREVGISCEPIQATDTFTEYRLRCNEAELIRLDTHLKQHRRLGTA